MYKFYFFLIALILTIFDISVWIFFGKSLDSNILILTCIMILPGLFSIFEKDVLEFRTMRKWRIWALIMRRKMISYFRNKIEKYSYIWVWIGTLYICLFLLIGNTEALDNTMTLILLWLGIGICASLYRTISTNS